MCSARSIQAATRISPALASAHGIAIARGRRRNLRGARNKLAAGLARLRPYEPAHHGIFVNELIGQATRLLGELNEGHLPYLIPPVIRFTDVEDPDFSR